MDRRLYNSVHLRSRETGDTLSDIITRALKNDMQKYEDVRSKDITSGSSVPGNAFYDVVVSRLGKFIGSEAAKSLVSGTCREKGIPLSSFGKEDLKEDFADSLCNTLKRIYPFNSQQIEKCRTEVLKITEGG